MRRLKSILDLGLALAVCAGFAWALRPSGRDASSGLASQPISRLAERIAAANPGDTIEVAPAVYSGLLTIDKPIHLVARPGPDRPVIDAGGHGNAVEIHAENVEIRGFLIRNTGIDLDGENVAVRVLAAGATIQDNVLQDVLFGIDCKAAPHCVIRDNVIGAKHLDIARRGDAIRLWRSDGTLIERNTMRDGRDAILWYSQGVTVRDNVAQRCRYGFHLMYSNDVTLERNTLTENSVGIYFMYSTGVVMRDNKLIRNRGPSGYGVGLKDTDKFVIERNTIVGNRVGIYMDNSPVLRDASVLVAHNTVAVNDVGMQLLPSVKGDTFTLNDFVDNFEQVSILGRGELTGNDFDRDGRGNFWSDYAGYDAAGDGVGDSEYESHRLFESLTDREPKLRLLLFSPAQQAIEFVGRALPAIEPEAKFSDPSPLMRPANAGGAPTAAAASNAAAPAIALLSLGLSIALAAFWSPIRSFILPHSARPRREARQGATA